MFDFIQHCFICCPSDSTVSEDARIELRTVATLALAFRRYIVQYARDKISSIYENDYEKILGGHPVPNLTIQ